MNMVFSSVRFSFALSQTCWQLLSGAGATGTRLAGDFVLEIFKTIRGYGGSAVCASQDLNDFFNLDGGRFGKGIINNSKTKIILNLEDEEAPSQGRNIKHRIFVLQRNICLLVEGTGGTVHQPGSISFSAC